MTSITVEIVNCFFECFVLGRWWGHQKHKLHGEVVYRGTSQWDVLFLYSSLLSDRCLWLMKMHNIHHIAWTVRVYHRPEYHV